VLSCILIYFIFGLLVGLCTRKESSVIHVSISSCVYLREWK